MRARSWLYQDDVKPHGVPAFRITSDFNGTNFSKCFQSDRVFVYHVFRSQKPTPVVLVARWGFIAGLSSQDMVSSYPEGAEPTTSSRTRSLHCCMPCDIDYSIYPTNESSKSKSMCGAAVLFCGLGRILVVGGPGWPPTGLSNLSIPLVCQTIRPG